MPGMLDHWESGCTHTTRPPLLTSPELPNTALAQVPLGETVTLMNDQGRGKFRSMLFLPSG
jgi:hypothetical protein